MENVKPTRGVVTGVGQVVAGTELDVVGTNNAIKRRGESVVTLSEKQRKGLGFDTTHVAVAPACTPRTLRTNRAVIARVAVDESLKSHTVGVDEVLRYALGVTRSDVPDGKGAASSPSPTRVRLSKAEAPSSLGRRLTGLLRGALLCRNPQNYVYLRVRVSGLYTAERNVALVDPLTLRLLGVDSGGYAMLEGVDPEPTGGDGAKPIRSLRLKVVERPDALVEERRSLEKDARAHGLGGDSESSRALLDSDLSEHAQLPLDARHWAPHDVLRVDMDIPEIYVDAAVRDKLGIGGEARDGVTPQVLGVVRARASIWHLLIEEAKSAALVFAVALAGVKIFGGGWVDWLGFLVPVALTGVISAFRIRHAVSLKGS